MSYRCRILLDSISETGKRITTFELTYPRLIHSEFMTHRMFSRNAASSRAIPAKRMRQMVNENCFIPDKFPKNIAGMQPTEWFEKESESYYEAKKEWKIAADNALIAHENLEKLGIHKQIANRLIEPFLWYTCIVTATEFDNFFKLRCDENAQYEIRRIADLMYDTYYNDMESFKHIDGVNGVHTTNATSTRTAIRLQKLKVGEWHCPLVSEEDDEAIRNYADSISTSSLHYYNVIEETRKQISVARCARVSYLTHDGKRDIEKDLELFERLKTSGHWSPFEHVATPYWETLFDSYGDAKSGYESYSHTEDQRSGNFIGWKQFRKEFQDENCVSFRKEN